MVAHKRAELCVQNSTNFCIKYFKKAAGFPLTSSETDWLVYASVSQLEFFILTFV